MANIQKTLDSLQPYVIGIRYLEGTPLVDVVFKEGWSIPEDQQIKRIKGNDELNYYMLFSEVTGVGLDELLGYVERTIKVNQERERKHELLRKKVTELKDVFQRNSLTKLSTLKFCFGDDDLIPKIQELEIDEEIDMIKTETPEIKEEIIIEEVEPQNIPIQYLDENKEPISLSDEDKEMIEEEKRAEINRKILANSKRGNTAIKTNIELPPKMKSQTLNATGCYCDANEACDKCIDQKDL